MREREREGGGREKNKLLDGLFIERFGQAVPFGAIRDDRRPRSRRRSASITVVPFSLSFSLPLLPSVAPSRSLSRNFPI